MPKRPTTKTAAQGRSKTKRRTPAAPRKRMKSWDMRNIDIVMPTSHVRADVDDRAQGNDAPPDHALWEEILRLLEDGPLNDVGIDARRRKILWPDAGPLDLEQSAKHIKLHYVDFPEETIRTFLIYWMSNRL